MLHIISATYLVTISHIHHPLHHHHRLWPSPSITNTIIITITIMVFVITLSILQWIILNAMCPLFVSLCDSIQTYSIIIPAEAAWQPDQLHFDDARPVSLCNCSLWHPQVKVRLHETRQAARLARDMLQRDFLRGNSVYMVGSCRARLLHIIHVSAVLGVGVFQRKLR